MFRLKESTWKYLSESGVRMRVGSGRGSRRINAGCEYGLLRWNSTGVRSEGSQGSDGVSSENVNKSDDVSSDKSNVETSNSECISISSDSNNVLNSDTNTISPPPSETITTTLSKLSQSRGKKLPPPPQEYIILGARSSRVIPRLKRPEKSTFKTIKVDDLDEQRKQLLVFTSDVSMDTALTNINRMKPPILTLSPKRYDQLTIDLKRSFAVAQLREYIRSKSSTLRSSGNKSQLINIILNNIWRVSISESVNESSDVIIERTFQLSRRELFIIVSQNSQLPRSWTKSGASIVILGDEQKIIVRATADTCNWIMASLHKVLQSIQDVDIDFSCLEPFASIKDIPLSQIQRLSDTYLRYQTSDKTLVASSKSQDHVDHAKRLILHSTGFIPRSSSSYIYDDKSTNRSLSRIIDDDALAWNERNRTWKRIKKIRRKQEFSSFNDTKEIITQPQNLTVAYAATTNKVNEKINEPTYLESSYEDTILKEILPEPDFESQNVTTPTPTTTSASPASDNQLTFTATFGYLLHDCSTITDNTINPLISQRTFLSNTPFIFQRCSELPLYHLETDHDTETPPPPPSSSPSSPSSDDPWNKLLADANLLSESIPQSSTTESEPQSIEKDDSMRLIQIKFIPSPFHIKDVKILQNLPPIEMWFEFKEDSDKCDFDSLRLVCSEQETNTYLSLPDFETDIKFSSTQAKFLNHEQEGIQNFINRAQLSITGNRRIYVPNELKVKLDDEKEELTYLYQSMCYRRQIDLSFKGHILQLSSLESGGFGGRRIEANLVLDYPEGLHQLNKSEVTNFIRDSFEFCQSLRRQAIHL